MLDSSKIHKWDYDEQTITDQDVETIIQQTVRSKFLDDLPKELPYQLKFDVIHLEIGDDKSIYAIVDVMCPSERILKLIKGKRGERIKSIALAAEQSLCTAFHTSMKLRLVVKFND